MANICKKCGNSFPIKQEVDGKLRNFQRRKYCLECSPFGSGNTRKLENPPLTDEHKKARQRYKDRDKYNRWQKQSRLDRKKKLVEMLGGSCSECGYKKCLAGLSFHHIDPESKSFGISEKGLLKKWNDLVEETKKCKLLCLNCHAETHYERLMNEL